MNDRNRQPREYDLVLGGNNPSPTDGLVLGGIEGVKNRLASDRIEVRIAALKDALKYDREGIDLVLAALDSEIELIRDEAYELLQSCSEYRVKTILNELDICPILKFDGIYQYFYFYPMLSHCRILKFYQDKTVISFRLEGKTNESSREQIVKYFNINNKNIRNNKNVLIGEYAIKGNKISFSVEKTGTKNCEREYDGKIVKNKIIFNTHHRIRPEKRNTKAIEYIFTSFDTLQNPYNL